MELKEIIKALNETPTATDTLVLQALEAIDARITALEEGVTTHKSMSRKGGMATTERKAVASRNNGRKGGRPKVNQ